MKLNSPGMVDMGNTKNMSANTMIGHWLLISFIIFLRNGQSVTVGGFTLQCSGYSPLSS